ncbi:C-X-C motif chemokine 16 isoform X1 [Ambystoma mexicanum]|uniref:C-X-C motif chemokine 16 isoform X1 n=1 Tax=Ambystoma mexicanum TaxID=8296 RepID=UPI0037E97F1F
MPPGHSAAGRGAIGVGLLLLLVPYSGWCQIGYTQFCDCSKSPQDINPRELASFAFGELNYELCQGTLISKSRTVTLAESLYSVRSLIYCESSTNGLHPVPYICTGFTSRKKTIVKVLCGNKDADWAKKLRRCRDTGDKKECTRKVDSNPPRPPLPVTTQRTIIVPKPESFLNTDPGPPSTQSTSSATIATSAWAPNDGDENVSHPKMEADGTSTWAREGDVNHRGQENSTPEHTTVAVLSLLAVVFILVAVVAFLICKRRNNPQTQYNAVARENLDPENEQQSTLSLIIPQPS